MATVHPAAPRMSNEPLYGAERQDPAYHLRYAWTRWPQEIALAFQNNTAYALGQKLIWTESYYAGTLQRVRYAGDSTSHGQRVAIQSASPSGKPDGVG